MTGTDAPAASDDDQLLDADVDGSRPLADRMLLAAVVVWLAMTVFLLAWQIRPQAGPSDSVAHVTLFTGLTFTVRCFVPTRTASKRMMWAATVGIVALAVTSELVQATFVAERDGSLSDLAADVLGVGLGVALSTSLRILPPKRARSMAAVSSTLAVALIAGFVSVSFVRESVWWRCRGSGGDPIENSASALPDGPMLEYEGDAQTWRGVDGEQTGPAASDRAASAAWCAAISSEELTLVVVADDDPVARSPVVELFGTSSGLDGATPNLKLERWNEVLTVRARHRVRTPNVYNYHFDDVFAGPGPQWVAVRYEDNEITVDTDSGQMLDDELEFAFGAWQTGLPMDVGDPSVAHVEFFDRSLTDRELQSAMNSLLN